MKSITIKVLSVCQAVEFFNVVNPFMFHDEAMARFRERPEWYFLDPVTGEPREVQVKIPDECGLSQDLGDVIRCDFLKPNMRRQIAGSGLYLDHPGASLALEYAIADGIKIPSDSDC